MARARIGKLTASFVDSAQPEDRDYELRDSELKGFVCRIRKTGHKSFGIFYRNEKNRTSRYTIGTIGNVTAVEARKIAKRLLGEIATGEDVQAEKRDKRRQATMPTLKEYIDGDFKDWVDEAGRHEFIVPRLKQAFSTLTNKRLDRITSWDIDGWRRKRRKGGIAPATTDRELAGLKKLFNLAIQQGLVEENPVIAVKLERPDNGRIRFLNQKDPGEESRLREALSARETREREAKARFNEWRVERGLKPVEHLYGYVDHLEPLVLLAMNTGCRKGELLALEWDNVDLARRQITVTAKTAKTKRRRHVKLSNEALLVLERWCPEQRRTGFVFPGPTGARMKDIKTAWTSLRQAAKLEDFTFHDLRHHFASKAVMNGADLYALSQVLGHSTSKMTERYAHLSPDHLQDVVDRASR